MTAQPNLAALANEIRGIHASDGRKAAENIEGYLTDRLESLPLEERLETLQKLMGFFEGATSSPAMPVDDNQEIVARLFSLILGKPVQPADLSSSELLQRLAESLNTIFNTLNRLVFRIPQGDLS